MIDAFRHVADGVRDPLLLIDPEGVVVAANRSAKSALGGDVEGRALLARVRDPGRLRRLLTLASRTTSHCPGSLVLRDDSTKWRCDASLARPGAGDDLLIMIHLRPSFTATSHFRALNQQIERLHLEIQRRAALESERGALLAREREARQQAEEAALLKDEFLASVSHEIRTPLHAIAGWVDLLRTQRANSETLERGLAVIERNVAAQTQLVDDLIDLSRAASGRMRLELEEVDIEAIIRQAVESARPAAEAKNQRIELVCTVGSCVINGDPSRLLQVVWNLLSNATKYTPPGGKIQVVVRRVNSHVEISVSDTGQGISEELLPYVFDRFRRGDSTTTRRQGGLGLGLSIVRHLVELHGGLVMADSGGEGRGSTFTVSLPLPLFRGVEAVERREPDAQASASASAQRLQGISVLLVEDHDDSRELLASILMANGAEVTAAESSKDAQAWFPSVLPDVVISDIEMPEEDGFTLIRKLRVLERELQRRRAPAIAVTAHSIPDARIHALRSGYQAFLVKPINASELVALIASLCEPEAT